MALTTTTSADGKRVTLEGTSQEVLDALDSYDAAYVINIGRDGANAWWAVCYKLG